MTKLRHALVLLPMISLSTGACKDAEPPAPPAEAVVVLSPAEKASKTVAAAVDHELAMLKIVAANQTDAAKAATELEVYLKTNEAALKTLKGEMTALKELAKDDMAMITDIMKANADKMTEVDGLKGKLREEAKDVYNDDKVRELLRSVRAM